MKNQTMGLGSAQERVLSRILDHLSEQAMRLHRADLKLLADRRLTTSLAGLKEDIWQPVAAAAVS